MKTHRAFFAPRLLRNMVRAVADPYRRYRNAKLIHATRVGLATLASILLTTGIRLPHGEWASITTLIVIGGLQHHGNIRKKAAERALGTLIGAAAGLLFILQQAYFGVPALTYFLLSCACGFAAYFAIGKAGYIALLSAITLMIVAGHGDSAILDGVWRSVEVLVGIIIALAFSFALPLYATYSWRYRLASALRGCARVHARIASGSAASVAEEPAIMAAPNTALVQLRSLMPSVSKEIRVPMAKLEEIQHSLRLCLSTLEVLWSMRATGNDTPPPLSEAMRDAHRRLRDTLVGMARALRLGLPARLGEGSSQVPQAPPDGLEPPADMAVLLMRQLADETGRLRQHLIDIAPRWNIGRRW